MDLTGLEPHAVRPHHGLRTAGRISGTLVARRHCFAGTFHASLVSKTEAQAAEHGFGDDLPTAWLGHLVDLRDSMCDSRSARREAEVGSGENISLPVASPGISRLRPLDLTLAGRTGHGSEQPRTGRVGLLRRALGVSLAALTGLVAPAHRQRKGGSGFRRTREAPICSFSP